MEAIQRRRRGYPRFITRLRTTSTRIAVAFCGAMLIAGLTASSALADDGPILVVNSTADTDDGVCDAGNCTLREAITVANQLPDLNAINFNITGGGPHTVQINSALPAITQPVNIDATTQPGFVGAPLVRLNGPGAFGTIDGLVVSAPGSTIRGLSITRFDRGIEVSPSGSATIRGCWIGLDASGIVVGNFTGVQVSGSGTTIGGPAASDRNVISGNSSIGVALLPLGGSIANHSIQGNYIGTNVAGTTAMGNSTGIGIQGSGTADNVLIGGTTSGERNVISGNLIGIFVAINGTGRVISGNYIGTAANGTSDVHNNSAGVALFNGGVTVGGTGAGAANVIAFNGNTGVSVGASGFTPTGISVRGNSIHSNTGLGIDLGADGLTRNDGNDADSGANGLQNYPVIDSATRGGAATAVTGTLASTPSSTFDVDFYSTTTCDASGFGEGRTYLSTHQVVTDGSGIGAFSPTLDGEHAFLTATATMSDGSTSEFSSCFASNTPGGTTADLAVQKSGSGLGTVSSSPGGIDCGPDCTNTYPLGMQVTLTATWNTNTATFSGWSGDCSGTSATCQVTMDQARNVTATFIAKHALTLTRAGTGTGGISSNPAGVNCPAVFFSICSGGTWVEGTVVTLTATPAAGSAFTGWTGACTNTSGTCQVTMSQPRSVGANFVPGHTLTVTKGGVGTGTVTSDPGHISCGATCSAPFAQNSTVTLTAAASAGSVFSHWIGACTPSGTTCSVPMTGAKTISAVFNLTPKTLTTEVTGSGTLTDGTGGIDCGTNCTQDYAHGTVVTLTATPETGWALGAWGGACAGTNAANNCSVTMSAARNATATFVITKRTLTTEATGSGSIASSPVGITCGEDCTQDFDYGTVVTLTATPETGWALDAWGGACSGTNVADNCSVTMSEARNATATFVITKRTLTTEATGSGSIASSPLGIACGEDCTHDFDYGTVVTLTATPVTGWALGAWGGACSGTDVADNCSVTMSEARNATATFVLTKRTLTTEATGSGSIASSPLGITCGEDCTHDFDYGTVVTLTATPEAGWRLADWGGACDGTSVAETCSVTMDQARDGTATFEQIKHALSVSKTGSGSVMSEDGGIVCGNVCSHDYVQGSSVTMSAFVPNGWRLGSWGGACSGTSSTADCTVSMSEARSVTATFEQLVPKPDGLIKLSTDTNFLGNQIYNATGANQTKRAATKRGTAKTFLIKVQNDGTGAGAFKLLGPGSGGGFTVKYLAGTTDITAGVVAGTYQTPSVAPGGSKTFKLVIKAKSSAAIGAVKAALVKISSSLNPTLKDAPKAVLNVIR